jgi:hypothetical protein
MKALIFEEVIDARNCVYKHLQIHCHFMLQVQEEYPSDRYISGGGTV